MAQPQHQPQTAPEALKSVWISANAGSGKTRALVDREDRSDYANEMTRITMRLTSVMAWIMVRRAIHAGRIDEAKASTDYRLEAVDVCREHKPEVLSQMPGYMNHLSEKSLALFERVHRLDDLAYGTRH